MNAPMPEKKGGLREGVPGGDTLQKTKIVLLNNNSKKVNSLFQGELTKPGKGCW
ncbi:MAG: hypothetical protein Q7K20_10065 [Polaromonas sp.]|jgi:hypothetical protein|nr:hypothetical protein [Polaromonas sp.]